MQKTHPIALQVGFVNGRDAIFVDEKIEQFSPHTLIFKGQFNGDLCTNNFLNKKTIPFVLKFFNVKNFECQHIDYNNFELELLSSFDLVENSEWLERFKLKNMNHYRLATYDYLYQIAACKFDLSLSQVDTDLPATPSRKPR